MAAAGAHQEQVTESTSSKISKPDLVKIHSKAVWSKERATSEKDWAVFLQRLPPFNGPLSPSAPQSVLAGSTPGENLLNRTGSGGTPVYWPPTANGQTIIVSCFNLINYRDRDG